MTKETDITVKQLSFSNSKHQRMHQNNRSVFNSIQFHKIVIAYLNLEIYLTALSMSVGRNIQVIINFIISSNVDFY